MPILPANGIMASTIFSLPVPAYRQTKVSAQNGSHTKKRKRTEGADSDETKSIDALSEADQQQHVHSHHSQSSEYSAILTPDNRSLYRIAGQPLDRSLPTKPFPHASQSNLHRTPDTNHSTSQRLASLDPPIYTPSPESRTLPLHQQHLGALTALLHRALCERDFARAGRVLGLILRDEIGGQPLDIRAEGRWGIGAEILLRQGTRTGHNGNQSTTGREEDGDKRSECERGPALWFTRKGFEDARKYYERLIVQYPFHKPNPGAVNALDFYSALFRLWICVVQEESKLDNESLDESTFSETSPVEDSALSGPTPSIKMVSKQRMLAQAREIAIRMDSCMTTIPYGDDMELIRLRGMVALWIADLLDDILEIQERHYEETEDDQTPADEVAADLTRRSRPQRPADDVSEDLRLEADRAREKSLEMQRKMQGHRIGLG